MGSMVLSGEVWHGTSATWRGGTLSIAADGLITEVARSAGPQVGPWLAPGLVDAHVHLSFGTPDECHRRGLAAVRDLGAPLSQALGWRSDGEPVVAVAGELLTAPGGYPSRSWGAAGFARGMADPAAAVTEVDRLVAAGVDVIKVALEPAGGPVPDPDTTRAAVDRAHARGLEVSAHALTSEMVHRALDAGVDELCHVPTEVPDADLLARMAGWGGSIVSTLSTHDQGPASAVRRAASALVAAGVPLVYGTDLGNAGTAPGPSVAELQLLADAGLGPAGALRAATYGASGVAGLRGRVDVDLEAGRRTVVVVLDSDPLMDLSAWGRPLAVLAGGRVVAGAVPEPAE